MTDLEALTRRAISGHSDDGLREVRDLIRDRKDKSEAARHGWGSVADDCLDDLTIVEGAVADELLRLAEYREQWDPTDPDQPRPRAQLERADKILQWLDEPTPSGEVA